MHATRGVSLYVGLRGTFVRVISTPPQSAPGICNSFVIQGPMARRTWSGPSGAQPAVKRVKAVWNCASPRQPQLGIWPRRCSRDGPSPLLDGVAPHTPRESPSRIKGAYIKAKSSAPPTWLLLRGPQPRGSALQRASLNFSKHHAMTQKAAQWPIDPVRQNRVE